MDSASKRRNAGDAEADAPNGKKSRKECRFGSKCYRKNPAHFEEFEHSHLDDILRRQKDPNNITLPSDIDPELKRISDIVLGQLKVLQKLKSNFATKLSLGNNANPSVSSSSTSKNNEMNVRNSRDSSDRDSSSQNSSTSKQSERKPLPSRESASTGRTKDSEAPSRESQRPNQAEMEKMIREATNHHGDVQAKLDAAAPYYFFLTAVADSAPTQIEPLTITFTELLDKGLGDLECSLQINFMVELGWMLAQYFYTGNRFKPLTLLYGMENDDLNERAKLPNNINAVKVKPPTAFGHHHTKMSILAYKDKSIRVIVSTANLVESDWENRTQGLWVSPRLPPLPPDTDTTAGESPTMFKADLLRYLNFYRLPQLQDWLTRVRKADFSSVRVCLVASVPGTHYGPDLHQWGHRKVLSLLKNHVQDPKDPRRPWSKWPIVGQFSSIGTLGPDANSWVTGELRTNMSAPSLLQEYPPMKLIYPCFDDVKGSFDGLLGGACLPYQKKVHQKQLWLTDYLHKWRSSGRSRSRAMPHIKSYARVSPCNSLLSWFLLTSANLSKAAWGAETKTKLPGQGLRILSYEVGVLFLPKFVVGDIAFNLETDGSSSDSLQPLSSSNSTKNRNDYPPFPLHYDLPLQQYKSGDTPWFYDVLLES